MLYYSLEVNNYMQQNYVRQKSVYVLIRCTDVGITQMTNFLRKVAGTPSVMKCTFSELLP